MREINSSAYKIKKMTGQWEAESGTVMRMEHHLNHVSGPEMPLCPVDHHQLALSQEFFRDERDNG
jgi:hypothetical protein